MSLNKVILIGNVGRDPEIRYFDNGNAIATFPLATSERGYKLPNGTEVPERTEWHNIVARRESVAFIEKWVKKGSSLYIEGKIRYRNYEDKQGIMRYVPEIYADKLDFFNNMGRTQDATGQQQAQTPATSQPAAQQQPAKAEDSYDKATGENDESDLPF